MAALATAGLATVTPHQDGARINLEGALAVTQSPDPAVVVEGAPGVTPDTRNWAVVIHAGMTADEVAEAMRQPLADAFAGGVVDVIKAYRHIVHIIGHDVADPGPLGYAPDLPGDANGTFGTRDRFLANTQVEYTFDEEEQDFTLLQEGVYVDDVIIGFAKQGEIRRDDRPVNPLLGDALPGPVPAGQRPGQFRRRAHHRHQRGGRVPVRDPSRQFASDLACWIRATVCCSRPHLIAPAGVELFDGKTFTLSDGLQTVVFEYEEPGDRGWRGRRTCRRSVRHDRSRHS